MAQYRRTSLVSIVTTATIMGMLVIPARAGDGGSLPPHRSMELDGLHAYAQKSVFAGETVQFRVSSSVPYELSVCRLGTNTAGPAGDDVLTNFPPSPAMRQPIHPGSYVFVDKSLPAEMALTGLTLECWVRPFVTSGDQTLLSQYDAPGGGGFALHMAAANEVRFYLGDGKDYRKEWDHAGPQLRVQQWQHVVGTWDGREKRLYVDGTLVGKWPHVGTVRPGPATLRLGAGGVRGKASDFLDGDLAMPVIYNRALSEAEIKKRFQDRGHTTATGPDVLACWPLTEERGECVADASGHERHGRIINTATWMIGGPAFDAAKVPRYGDYDPHKDPTRGHGLRFASDDLYDCRWQVTHEYRLPETAKPGLYVGRFRFKMSDGYPLLYHVTFIVKRAPARPRPPLLVLASSFTWLAYNASPFAVTPHAISYNVGWDGFPSVPAQYQEGFEFDNSAGNPPAFGMYRNHHQSNGLSSMGQPGYQVGVNVPWPDTGPYMTYGPGGYGHVVLAERYLHIWLENHGYDYDMVGDHELDRDPGLLQSYRTIVINGHAEYYSARALDGLERFLRGGGNLIVLSGNTMFWRVSFDPSGNVMECRKFDVGLGGRQNNRYGEIWHSQDGRKGSTLRECGYPEWQRIGLGVFGWGMRFGRYRVAQADHFLFHQPAEVGLAAGEMFGGREGDAWPKAVGHEYDAMFPLILRHTKKVPPGAVEPVPPVGVVNLADGIIEKAPGFDCFFKRASANDDVACNMIYWERPEGGRVFNSGSIGYGWALSADPKLQILLDNVLHHFGIKPSNKEKNRP